MINKMRSNIFGRILILRLYKLASWTERRWQIFFVCE